MYDNVMFYGFIIPLLYITIFVCTVTFICEKIYIINKNLWFVLFFWLKSKKFLRETN